MSNLDKRISLEKAAKISGYHRDYLGYLIRNNKIKGYKIGRNWYTSRDSLKDYLFQRNPKISLFLNSNKINKIIIITFVIILLIFFLVINSDLEKDTFNNNSLQSLDEMVEPIYQSHEEGFQ